jgi:hypothetical protein
MRVLLGGIRVVESHDQLAFKCLLIVLIEQDGFRVADVQIAASTERSGKGDE